MADDNQIGVYLRVFCWKAYSLFRVIFIFCEVFLLSILLIIIVYPLLPQSPNVIIDTSMYIFLYVVQWGKFADSRPPTIIYSQHGSRQLGSQQQPRKGFSSQIKHLQSQQECWNNFNPHRLGGKTPVWEKYVLITLQVWNIQGATYRLDLWQTVRHHEVSIDRRYSKREGGKSQKLYSIVLLYKNEYERGKRLFHSSSRRWPAIKPGIDLWEEISNLWNWSADHPTDYKQLQLQESD